MVTLSILIGLADSAYNALLDRIRDNLSDVDRQEVARLELPPCNVEVDGSKTFLRNFSEYPKILRREPEKILQYLAKEFAVPTERIGDMAMFAGRRDLDDFTRLFQIYLNDYVICPTCQSPDTHAIKESRVSFLICEACGARSTLKGKYA